MISGLSASEESCDFDELMEDIDLHDLSVTCTLECAFAIAFLVTAVVLMQREHVVVVDFSSSFTSLDIVGEICYCWVITKIHVSSV